MDLCKRKTAFLEFKRFIEESEKTDASDLSLHSFMMQQYCNLQHLNASSKTVASLSVLLSFIFLFCSSIKQSPLLMEVQIFAFMEMRPHHCLFVALFFDWTPVP